MDFLVDNWEVIFSGFGTAVVAAVLAMIFKKLSSGTENTKDQEANAGTGSQIIQAGRDANVGDFQANKDSPKR